MNKLVILASLLGVAVQAQADGWGDPWSGGGARTPSQAVSGGIEARAHFPRGEFFRPPQTAGMAGRTRVVQGEPNFEKVAALPLGDSDRNLASMVGLIKVDDSFCTGFLVGADLMLTNHHCVYNKQAGRAVDMTRAGIYMEYLYKGDLGPRGAGVIEVLSMDRGLDYALLRLDRPLGDQLGWFELDAVTLNKRMDVKVIQHPAARPKEIARRESRIVTGQGGELVHYLADTEPGSSGSPVLLKDGKTVVALHHAGYKNAYNEGIQMSAIIPRIEVWLAGGGGDGGGSVAEPPRPDDRSGVSDEDYDAIYKGLGL